MRKEPKTPAEWQEAVDAAAGARALADCMMYGLLKGPAIDVKRCDELLEAGSARGVYPSRAAGDLALEMVAGINAEAKGKS